MNFNPNKTPIEIIKEGAFEVTYLRDIYSGINGKWYRKSWKEFDQLKNIDTKYYASYNYDVNVNKFGVKCGTSSRFWENKVKDQKMMRGKLIDGKILWVGLGVN